MLEMRNVLSTKLNKKGFTLAELLVVVAIIAILVAVSIPIFTGRLTKAKTATDEANLRAAKAAAVTEYLSDDTKVGDFYYDADTGKLVTSTAAKSIKAYGQTSDHKNKIVKVVIKAGDDDSDPVVTPTWENKPTA